MIDVLLKVGPYSLVQNNVPGNIAAGKFSVSVEVGFDTSHKTRAYFWRDGEWRDWASTDQEPLGGWWNSLEEILDVLNIVYPGEGEVI